MHYVEIIPMEVFRFAFVDLAVSDKKKRHIDDDGPGRKVKKECFFQETYGKLRDKTTTTAFVLVDSDK